MARRSTPDRIYQAQRAATVMRLQGDGVLADRAEALVASWEFAMADDGRARDGRWWEDAWRWIASRRSS